MGPMTSRLAEAQELNNQLLLRAEACAPGMIPPALLFQLFHSSDFSLSQPAKLCWLYLLSQDFQGRHLWKDWYNCWGRLLLPKVFSREQVRFSCQLRNFRVSQQHEVCSLCDIAYPGFVLTCCPCCGDRDQLEAQLTGWFLPSAQCRLAIFPQATLN